MAMVDDRASFFDRKDENKRYAQGETAYLIGRITILGEHSTHTTQKKFAPWRMLMMGRWKRN